MGFQISNPISTPEPVTIRQFVYPSDYPTVIALWENAGTGVRLGRSDQPQEMMKILQRNPDLFLVAETANRIVGAVMGGFDGRRGMMYHLAVMAEYRTLGIGRQLMEELETRLRAKGCLRYYLLVTTDNREAIGFYESHGWRRMDHVYAYGKDLVE